MLSFVHVFSYDIIFFLHSTEQKTIPSTGINFWPIKHLLQQEHKKHSSVACQLKLLYVTRWTSGSIALWQPWQICLEKKSNIKKSLKACTTYLQLQQKMEFLDVFKEYRQVSKEAFEISLQFLISPLFSDQNAVEEKKKNRIKTYVRSQLLLGLSLRQLWWLWFPSAQSRIRACHTQHRSSYINPCIWRDQLQIYAPVHWQL